MNLWVKKADEPFDKARLITAETKRPIRGYFWSRDSKYILFVNDFGGDENFNVRCRSIRFCRGRLGGSGHAKSHGHEKGSCADLACRELIPTRSMSA